MICVLQPLNLSKLFCARALPACCYNIASFEQHSASFSSRLKSLSLFPIYSEVSVEASGIHFAPIVALHQTLLDLCIAVIFLVDVLHKSEKGESVALFEERASAFADKNPGFTDKLGRKCESPYS
jgi:hypothetical protein